MAVVSGIATPAAEAIADEAIAHKNKTKEKSHPHTLSDPANQNTPNKQRKKKLFPYHHPPPTPHPFHNPKKNPKKKREKKGENKEGKSPRYAKSSTLLWGEIFGEKKPKKKQTNKQTKPSSVWLVTLPLGLAYLLLHLCFFFFWGAGGGGGGDTLYPSILVLLV
jgi:hypothetical protein